MITTCGQLEKVLSGFSLVKECHNVGDGTLRFATPFLYPNGSNVDLFLKKSERCLVGEFVLTDLGNTAAWLLDLHIKPWSTKKRQMALKDICDSLSVTHEKGELRVWLALEDVADLPGKIVSLAQACLRMADLVFTQRLQVTTPFREEFEEYLAVLDVNYDAEVMVLGRFGELVPVDFQVVGQSTTTLIQTPSTERRANSHPILNEVFRRWYDLKTPERRETLLTVYDDRTNVFKDEDLLRIADVSLLLAFPAQSQDIKDILLAA